MRKNKLVTKVFAGMMVTALVLQSTPMAAVSTQAAQKVVIKTQKQLDAALKNKNVTAIEIRTTSGTTFSIKSGTYNKSIEVNSTKAKVVNNGKFKSVTVKNANSFTEKADNNKINITDKSLNLNVAKGADNSKITVSSTGGNINVKADGKVASVTVNKKTTLKVSGSTPKAVKITSNAIGANIYVASKANVQLNKASVVSVSKGTVVDTLVANKDANITVAQGATVKKVEVKGTSAKVNVKANGAVASVSVAAKAEVAVTGTTTSTVKVEANTEGAKINTAVKTEVTANANVNVTVEKGAEGSSVKVGKENVTPTVSNKSGEAITIIDFKGTETKVDAGQTTDTNPGSSEPETPVTPPSTGGDEGQTQLIEYDVYIGFGPASGNTFTVDTDAMGLTKESFLLKKGDKVITITNVRESEGGYAITIENFDVGTYTLTIKGDGKKYKDTDFTFTRDTIAA